MRPLNNRGLIRKENMFILNNIDDDLRVLIDLDDNSDVNDVGVDTLPYTFILLEDKTYWDEFEEIKRKPQWEVIFSEKFNEYSFICVQNILTAVIGELEKRMKMIGALQKIM